GKIWLTWGFFPTKDTKDTKKDRYSGPSAGRRRNITPAVGGARRNNHPVNGCENMGQYPRRVR
ncbi:MAG: hypothetical protein IKO65_03525, partial [Victivallales bacterium]|nr:hypothetical protein [Victivallales bacterium]